MKLHPSRLLLPLLVVLAASAHGAPEDVIRARLKGVMPDAQITSIVASPVSGLYQVSSKNYEPVLATADGRYLIQGEMLEIQGSNIVNVSDQMMAAVRKPALAAVKPEDMVVFPAIGKMKAVVYVFTDVDCGYCRKFHTQVPELNKQGIEVRYLAFPRGGPSAPVVAKLNGVWCAKDRQAALTQAKRGGPVPAAPPGCKTPVVEEYELGTTLGVTGTPAVFDAEGMQLGGYLPADELLKDLKLR